MSSDPGYQRQDTSLMTLNNKMMRNVPTQRRNYDLVSTFDGFNFQSQSTKTLLDVLSLLTVTLVFLVLAWCRSLFSQIPLSEFMHSIAWKKSITSHITFATKNCNNTCSHNAGDYLVDQENVPKHLFRMENMLKYTYSLPMFQPPGARTRDNSDFWVTVQMQHLIARRRGQSATYQNGY